MAGDFWADLDKGEQSPKSDFWGGLDAPGKSSRERYVDAMKDPSFRSKPAEERGRIMFPESVPDRSPTVAPAPSRGIFGSMQDEAARGARTAGEGWHEALNPRSYGRTLAGAPIGNILAGTAQQVMAPVTGPFNEIVSRPLGNLARSAPVPDPETLGQQTEMIADIAGPSLVAKGLGALKAPLARALPTVQEKIATLGTKRDAAISPLLDKRLSEVDNTQAWRNMQVTDAGEIQAIQRSRLNEAERLYNLDQAAYQAQGTNVRNQARTLSGIPARKAAIETQAAQDIFDTQANLASAQSRVGKEAAQAAAPIGAKRANFDTRYGNLRKFGDTIQTQPVNLNTKALGVTREPGVSGITNPAERGAASITRQLTEGPVRDIEEEIGNTVRRMITEGGEVKNIDYNAITRRVLGDATLDNVSMTTLFDTRQRLRAAKRAAYDAEHKNLGRQFGNLEDAVTADIDALAKTDTRARRINSLWNKVDADYTKKKSAEWYAQGVDQAFNPTTAAWERNRFTKWWDKFSDSTNNDRDLRRLLGDRYESTKGVIEEMQSATASNIEKAAKDAVRNINRRKGEELRGLSGKGGLESSIEKAVQDSNQIIQKARTESRRLIGEETRGAEKSIGEQFAAKRIGIKDEAKATEAQIKAIEDEYRMAVQELTGRPYEGRFHKLMGTLGVIGGAGSTVVGAATVNPAMIAGGMKSIAGGSFTLMTHDMFTKLINTTKGASLIRRAVRATPGTGEAISASVAIGNMAKQLASEPGPDAPEIDMRSSSEKPRVQNADGTVSSERTIGIEMDGKHYLIPTIINGKQVTSDEALRQFSAGTNKPVGIYGSREAADRAGKARTERLSREMQAPRQRFRSTGRPDADSPPDKTPVTKRLQFDRQGNLIP